MTAKKEAAPKAAKFEATEDLLKSVEDARAKASDHDKPALTKVIEGIETLLADKSYARKGVAPLDR